MHNPTSVSATAHTLVEFLNFYFVRDLIEVKPGRFLISGNPNPGRFDFIFNVPSKRQKELPFVVTNTLASAFDLKISIQERKVPVLVVQKFGAENKLTPGDPAHVEELEEVGENGVLGKNCKISTALEALENYFDYPVVDETGLSGSFNFKLEWSLKGLSTPRSRSEAWFGDRIIERKESEFNFEPVRVAMEKQLGLTLQPAIREIEVTVFEFR